MAVGVEFEEEERSRSDDVLSLPDTEKLFLAKSGLRLFRLVILSL